MSAFDHHDDSVVLSSNGAGQTFEEILERRVNRRDFLKTVGLTVAAASAANLLGGASAAQAAESAAPVQAGVAFKAIKPVVASSARPAVAEGHIMSVVLRWGDPLFKDSPTFDPKKLTAAAQEKQFGYNADFVGLLPHPDDAKNANRGLLVVNHEYTNPELMFAKYKAQNTTKEIVDVELAAHGLTVVELKREGSQWSVVLDSKYNRRITANTPFVADGPAAGSEWLKTNADATGTKIAGTLNNCAGGKTPWGTVLSAEENFNQYFANAGKLAEGDARIAMHSRYGLPTGNSCMMMWGQRV